VELFAHDLDHALDGLDGRPKLIGVDEWPVMEKIVPFGVLQQKQQSASLSLANIFSFHQKHGIVLMGKLTS
jgi:hypothetical protein